jgi:hypothetical protein
MCARRPNPQANRLLAWWFFQRIKNDDETNEGCAAQWRKWVFKLGSFRRRIAVDLATRYAASSVNCYPI